MRKEGAWRGLQAALCMGMVCGVLLACGTARADNARDGVVNPGNARHLGPTDDKLPPPAAPADDAEEDSAELTDAELDAAADVEATPAMLEEARQREAAEAAASEDTAAAAEDSGSQRRVNHSGTCQQELKDFEFAGPMGITGQHPASVLFYQPVPDAATVLDSGSTVSVKLDWMNLILREVDSGILTDYDYEELRTTFDYRRRLGGGELQASLPVYQRGPGVLDPVIEGWHKLFGMNNGLRDTYPETQFHYTVISRDGLVYNGVGDTVGIGDLSLAYKGRLSGSADSRQAMAWRVGVKAPTGDSADALGSGNWDYSAGLLYQRQVGARLRLYANVDYVATGEPDWQNVAKHDVWHTMWAAEYAWSPRFSLLAQYSTATNPLRVGSFEADKDPRELSIGFNHRLSDKLLWSGGFREDISPETAPDLVFMSHLKWNF